MFPFLKNYHQLTLGDVTNTSSRIRQGGESAGNYTMVQLLACAVVMGLLGEQDSIEIVYNHKLNVASTSSSLMLF